MPVLDMFGVPFRHCINGITKYDKVNIDSIPSLDERITDIENFMENWTIVSNESEIFETVNGEKYFKHDTFIYYDKLGSRIMGYFIKGFPKKDVKISDNFIDSSSSDNLGFVLSYLIVTNDDRFQIRDSVIVFDFNQNPIKTQDTTNLLYPEYGTEYNQTGKLIFSIRTT